MNTVCTVTVLSLVFLIGSAFGQDNQPKREITRYAEIPHEQILIVVASQPGCPVRIEEVSYLVRLDNLEVVQRYKIRNISDKPIETFSLFSYFITGSGGTLLPPRSIWKEGKPLMPGEVIDSMEGKSYEIVPLTEDIKAKFSKEEKLDFSKGVQRLFILIVESVLFTDGSTYKDKKTSESLGTYLNRIELVW